MDIFNEIIATDLNADEAYFHRAKCELNLRLFRFAEEDAHDAIQLNPHRLDYYVQLAEILQAKEKFVESMKVCNNGLKLNVNNAELLEIQRKCKDQIEEQTSVQPLSASSVSDLMELGKVFCEFQNWKQAEVIFDRVHKQQHDPRRSTDERIFLLLFVPASFGSVQRGAK